MTSRFKIERVRGAPVSTEELIDDMRRASEIAQTEKLTMKLYAEHGKYHETTPQRRFGSWNKAIIAAGLRIANEQNYGDDRLFENMMRVWEHYGRQPRRSEIDSAPSTISSHTYNRRFGSWMKALEQFVVYAGANDKSEATTSAKDERTSRRGRAPPQASLRLRFYVLKRDNFSCRACGASPALTPGLLLHVDHLTPRSRGGETAETNLQTLCQACNLGKSNVL